jgi:hypothetical protein
MRKREKTTWGLGLTRQMIGLTGPNLLPLSSLNRKEARKSDQTCQE